MSDGWWPGKYASAESAEVARLEDAAAAARADADDLATRLGDLADEMAAERAHSDKLFAALCNASQDDEHRFSITQAAIEMHANLRLAQEQAEYAEAREAEA